MTSKQSTKQLQIVIEKQEEQLKRYEARLRDVVQAYKGLQKEKHALEKSLNVLSPSKNGENDKSEPGTSSTPTKPNLGEQSGIETTQEFCSTAAEEATFDGGESSTNVDSTTSSSVTNLKGQVETLRESLKTVMGQKTKMENSFQADKKKYLHELQVIEDTFAEDRNDFLKEKMSLQHDIQESRNRTRHEQQARESEQNDHVLMLKELQLVVSKERLSNEELQSKLNHLNKSLEDKQAERNGDGNTDMTASSNVAQNTKENSSPTLLQLQEEMLEMKTQLEQDILAEQLRANEADARAAMIAKAEEQRVADLEAKLSDLSQVVGKYERLRSHDLSEIHKLKDRLYELNMNSKPSEAPDNRNEKNGTSLDNEMSLNDVFQKVKDILRSRVQNNDVTESDITGISKAELEYILKNDPAHKACQDELRQLKDEFECYKAKVQTSRSNTAHGNEADNKDLDKLRAQISDLRNTVESLQRELETKQDEFGLEIEAKSQEITELCVKQNSELENERMIYNAKLQELENQVQKQRNRTLGLITEKDSEIERLKTKLSEISPTTRNQPRKTSHSDTAVRQLLSQASPSKLVHFAQEQAFCEAELELLRKQRSELEDTISDITHREQHIAEQNQMMKEEIRKLERNKSRENANLEYVKNVVLRYLLTDSDSVRHQMVAAIAQILQFSPKELTDVKKRSKTWWSR